MNLQNTGKCIFCNKNPDDLEKHLREDHFLDIFSFYEMSSKRLIDNLPLTYIVPDHYNLRDWDSIKRKYEKKQITLTIQDAIIDYIGKVITDRFLQMFLVGPIYFDATPTHTYEEFRSVLKGIQEKDRNKIWFLDWFPGFPKMICKENLHGIKLVEVDSIYRVSSSDDKITLNHYTVKFPDLIPLDTRHYGRYNIFNVGPAAKRETKRLKIKERDDYCVRFFSKPSSASKAIFQITDDRGNPVRPESLGELDLTVLKILLLRNKNFLRLIRDVIRETTRQCGLYSDSVFLKNTVTIDPEKMKVRANISWTGSEAREDFINISIL